jgi:hypothetical protein
MVPDSILEEVSSLHLLFPVRPMPLIRDDDEERRTRVEHMLDQLNGQHDGVGDYELTRIRTAAAAEALRSATRTRRAARLERARQLARTAQTPKSNKR